MTTILHIIAVVCVAIITACTISIWCNAPKQLKTKIMSGAIGIVAIAVFATVLVWLLFIAPTSIY